MISPLVTGDHTILTLLLGQRRTAIGRNGSERPIIAPDGTIAPAEANTDML